jgi:hypothetical protein
VKIVAIPKFITPYGSIEFVPVADVPGSSHRVAVNGVLQTMWVPATTSPNQKAAKFYIRLHRALQDGKPLYFYADKNEDPPLPHQVDS